MMPRIKICCIQSLAEANLAIDCGASALGLVAQMPSGPGVIADELIKEIASKIPPPIATFMLTSENSALEIIAHHKKTLTNTIQIVDELKFGSYDMIKNVLPAIKIVQVVHVLDNSSVEYALEVSEKVDALLLDSGNPNLQIKKLGGTGRTHDWELSKKIVESVKIPVFLAGGINAQNIKQAIEEVRPFGIDLCSSVRTNGHLDKIKLTVLFNSIN